MRKENTVSPKGGRSPQVCSKPSRRGHRQEDLSILKVAVAIALILVGILLIASFSIAVLSVPTHVSTSTQESVSDLAIPQNTTVSLPPWDLTGPSRYLVERFHYDLRLRVEPEPGRFPAASASCVGAGIAQLHRGTDILGRSVLRHDGQLHAQLATGRILLLCELEHCRDDQFIRLWTDTAAVPIGIFFSVAALLLVFQLSS